ncbi:MAG: hypothetical protein HY815_18780, partial [Candidatus Riflebacteria bacterium]|nr:hypothetical protein [Candidatus Riflebacteria bacterium]
SGIDERLAKIRLRYQAPAVDASGGSLKQYEVEYRVIGKTQPPPTNLPAAKPRCVMTHAGREVCLLPVVREVFTVSGGTAQSKEIRLLGFVTSLSFYQIGPDRSQVGAVSLPTVYVKLSMSAVKSLTGGYMEAYREELSTGLTARGKVLSVVARS